MSRLSSCFLAWKPFEDPLCSEILSAAAAGTFPSNPSINFYARLSDFQLKTSVWEIISAKVMTFAERCILWGSIISAK